MNELTAFKFQQRHGSMDWRAIGRLQLEEIIEKVDTDSLESVLDILTFSKLSVEDLERFPAQIILNMFTITQLCLEYLLNIQNSLFAHLNTIKETLKEANGKIKTLNDEKSQLLTSSKSLKRDLRNKDRALTTYEFMLSINGKVTVSNLTNNSNNRQGGLSQINNNTAHICPHCNKVFATPSYLRKHKARRHPNEPDPPVMAFNNNNFLATAPPPSNNNIGGEITKSLFDSFTESQKQASLSAISLAKLETEANILKDEAIKLRDEATKLREDKTTLKNQLSNLEEHAHVFSQENEQLKQQLSALGVQVESKQAEILSTGTSAANYRQYVKTNQLSFILKMIYDNRRRRAIILWQRSLVNILKGDIVRSKEDSACDLRKAVALKGLISRLKYKKLNKFLKIWQNITSPLSLVSEQLKNSLLTQGNLNKKLLETTNELNELKEKVRIDGIARQRRAAELMSNSPKDYTNSEIDKVLQAYLEARDRGIDSEVRDLMNSIHDRLGREVDKSYSEKFKGRAAQPFDFIPISEHPFIRSRLDHSEIIVKDKINAVQNMLTDALTNYSISARFSNGISQKDLEDKNLIRARQKESLTEDTRKVMAGLDEMLNDILQKQGPPPPKLKAKLYHHGINVYDEDRTNVQIEAVLKAMVPVDIRKSDALKKDKLLTGVDISGVKNITTENSSLASPSSALSPTSVASSVDSSVTYPTGTERHLKTSMADIELNSSLEGLGEITRASNGAYVVKLTSSLKSTGELSNTSSVLSPRSSANFDANFLNTMLQRRKVEMDKLLAASGTTSRNSLSEENSPVGTSGGRSLTSTGGGEVLITPISSMKASLVSVPDDGYDSNSVGYKTPPIEKNDFEQATEKSKSLKTSNEEKLQLYAMFKFVKEGKGPNPSERPLAFNAVERAKFDAWQKVSTSFKSVDEAKKSYVDLVAKLDPTFKPSNTNANIATNKSNFSMASSLNESNTSLDYTIDSPESLNKSKNSITNEANSKDEIPRMLVSNITDRTATKTPESKGSWQTNVPGRSAAISSQINEVVKNKTPENPKTTSNVDSEGSTPSMTSPKSLDNSFDLDTPKSLEIVSMKEPKVSALSTSSSDLFEQAAEKSKSLKTSNEEKLQLYAMFKFVKEGKGPNPSERPLAFNAVERAKFDAWQKVSTSFKSVDEAKKSYVDLVDKLDNK